MLRWTVALVLLAASAGCLNTFEEPEAPHDVRIVGIDVEPATVFAQDVLLLVTTALDNRGGGASGSIRLEVKAYSEERGFLLVENETTRDALPPDRSSEVELGLRVPREGGVRIEVLLYEDDLGSERASVTARNLGSLEPNILDTGLRISDVDFLVLGVANDTGTTRATIRADLYVTNEGQAASEDLRVQVKAREAQTGLVADIQWVTTSSVAPGATVIRSVNLTVPDDYNYVFEILTWRGDAVVARSEGTVQLAPTFVKPTDTEVVTTDPNVGDFARPGSPPTAYPTADGSYAEPAVPGPAPALVLAAVAALALVLRRRP